MKNNNFTYKKSGVNISKADKFVKFISTISKKTINPKTNFKKFKNIGSFGSIFDLSKLKIKEPVIVSSTDGVGTKIEIANQIKKFDSIGIDLVAMCVNDLIVQGAKPLFFLDYISINKLELNKTKKIILGIVKGCKLAGCELIGGETAEMPGTYGKGKFDIAGFSVGIVEKKKLLTKINVKKNNLILASVNIGKGDLDTKVPEIKTDIELETLNKNFNLMINQLKSQQEKLLLSERHEAWESVARKLAHEIKNPLTPIQLTIDRLKNKYEKSIDVKEKENFDNYLKTIIKQINQIENLVNEFSDFARMPKPIFRNNEIIEIIKNNISLLKEVDKSISIKFNYNKTELSINCDGEQISRAFFNLIKNSIESIQEKATKNADFTKIIDIAIKDKSDYIAVNITDNGTGFSTGIIKNITKPYFTTKPKGSGLGLSIVNKIINDHNGSIKFNSNENGAKVEVILPIN